MNKDKRLLNFFFWFTFAAFLSPSIPHIAFFFHAFEPQSTPGVEDIFWWVICYAIAISIDGTIIWLSRTVAVTRREKTASSSYIGGIWAFIIFLTAVSWLLNWLYARHNINTAIASLSGGITDSIYGLSFTKITPVIASMFPLLAIMFTFMADKVVSERVKSVQELKEELNELDGRLQLENQIKAKKQEGRKGWIARAKDTALEVKQAVNELRENEPLAVSKPEGQEEVKSQNEAPKNEVPLELLPEVQIEPIPENEPQIEETEIAPQPQFSEDILKLLTVYPNIQQWLSTGQKTATIEEVMKVTHHSKKRLANRLNDGTLKRHSRNKDLILISTVIEWLKVAPLPSQNGHDTSELEAVKLNGTH